MATTIVLDTRRLVEKLKQRGFTEQQATGITEAFQEIDLNQMATKADLRELELSLTNTLTGRMIAVVGVGVALLALLKFV